MKLLRYLIPLALFVGLAVLLASGLGKDPRVVPSPLVGKAAPAFELPTLRDPGRRFGTSDLTGKPYLLNVWATWCVMCREEHETLMSIARTKLVPIVGLDWKDDHPSALLWLRQLGDPYAEIVTDDSGKVAIDFGVYGAPESFLVDGNGTIVHKFIGPLTPGIVERELKPRLATLNAGTK
jgi:cytochrome c biogenesis protein CcmG/thiol:disulfide interchange protein DsbE